MAFPIACAYSHIQNGLPALWRFAGLLYLSVIISSPGALSPSLPRSSSHSTVGYMRLSTSASGLPRSQCIGRDGSSAFTCAIAFVKQTPCPVSSVRSA